jgi:hypothetical protein
VDHRFGVILPPFFDPLVPAKAGTQISSKIEPGSLDSSLRENERQGAFVLNAENAACL